MPKNLFCESSDLHNEADVEQIFARRFIEHLGYNDEQVRAKHSLTQLTIGEMRGKYASYRPDFAIKVGNRVRWIFEAKSPDESLDNHIWQPKSYCIVLNGQYVDLNPVEYYILSNGLETRLYKWDVNKPIIVIAFDEMTDGNANFGKLIEYLLPIRFDSANITSSDSKTHTLIKYSVEDVNAAFAWCHQFIYKKDNISQAAAFTEFVKVIFLKLLSDRFIRDKYPEVFIEESIEVPLKDVKFSLTWIDEQTKYTANPLNNIWFRDFINDMEQEIIMGKRKRIFDRDEEINLSPETIRGVVEKVEKIFLFGIDVDLNGRLFETFLNATMRGKDLGQYFTPRSIVKLGTKLAQIAVNISKPDGTKHTDIVLDACCGTGGFLIDVLAVMWDKVDSNSSLGKHEKDELKQKIANQHIYGVDVGREPPLARIARLNMYLHGDGGAGIYQVDVLDKQILIQPNDSPELANEKRQIQRHFNSAEGFADIVITNPPFAKAYDQGTLNEARILSEYRIISRKDGGKRRESLKSSLMFIERYHDLLKIGGSLITVIDDGILSGEDYKWFRNYIRENFIIRAVISLPGDAFQRSTARVKTSLLIMQKRDTRYQQEQPSVFMYGCQYVGIDDPARHRTLPIDLENRNKAREEIELVTHEYLEFTSGNGNPQYIVPPDRLADRLDVKSCLMLTGRQIKKWKSKGLEVVTLSDIVSLKEFADDDIINTREHDDFITYLRVRYDGFAQAGDEILASETNYPFLYRVTTDDIVISNIAASYGSVAIVPKELDGCVVSSEYTVLRANQGIDNRIIWLLMRSPEVRAEMLLRATGISRHRVKWEQLRNIQIPKPDINLMGEIIEILHEAEEAEKKAEINRRKSVEILEGLLDLNNSEANHILRAFKPPK